MSMIDFESKTPYDPLKQHEFQDLCQQCQGCELAKTRTQVVLGDGPIPCDIMLIGEGPGKEEDLKGKPFIGRSGKLLTQTFESVGIQRDTQLYITNTVKCRPPNNRTPLSKEIKAYKPFLIKELHLVKPKILLLVGTPAFKTIVESTLPISKARGKWIQAPVPYMDNPLEIMPLFHPSYLLRNASKEPGKPKWLTQQDIKKVKDKLSVYKK
ncbi:MAG: uracil-DNA glycosylase [Actinobacteria bacterium]|nr:uracil-DNA glycosylase [Actinomycetota bacterium]